jgi:hypothetical protein
MSFEKEVRLLASYKQMPSIHQLQVHASAIVPACLA